MIDQSEMMTTAFERALARHDDKQKLQELKNQLRTAITAALTEFGSQAPDEAKLQLLQVHLGVKDGIVTKFADPVTGHLLLSEFQLIEISMLLDQLKDALTKLGGGEILDCLLEAQKVVDLEISKGAGMNPFAIHGFYQRLHWSHLCSRAALDAFIADCPVLRDQKQDFNRLLNQPVVESAPTPASPTVPAASDEKAEAKVKFADLHPVAQLVVIVLGVGVAAVAVILAVVVLAIAFQLWPLTLGILGWLCWRHHCKKQQKQTSAVQPPPLPEA